MKTLFKIFKAGAKFLNLTRLIIINSLFFIIVLILLVTLSSEEIQVEIADHSVLRLNLNGKVVEQKQTIDFSAALSKQMLSDEKALLEYPIDELLQVIKVAQLDAKIESILLDISGLQSASLNHITAIGDALNEFKLSDKKVFATADNYSQIQYLLASYANKIYLDPQGLVMLQGFSVYRLYFKELLDNLLITPHIFKVGTFKSFVEPFTEKHMSDASKTANSHWLKQLWQGYINTVMSQRKGTNITAQSISPDLDQLKSALQKTQGDTALYALQVGLVDALLPRYKVLQEIQANEQQWVSYDDYQATMPSLYKYSENSDQIALIHGQGEILAGSQHNNVIGGDSFSGLLKKALNNDHVKAVVIRLDTPGGSAFASEKIRQQLLELKKAGKVVVVSMGSVCASGGYWIASAADYIVASPSTLTGSIGIFGLYASADKALNKIGIYNDGVGTTALSALDPSRPLDPKLADIMQMGIENGYQKFLSVVSEGRAMSLKEVDKVAQGRVWTGVDALSLQLVDQLGSLQDAIDKAARLANISDYSIYPIKKRVSTKEQLLNEIFNTGVKILPHNVQFNASFVKTFLSIKKQASLLTSFNDPKGHYTYCPMCFINQ
ncbi:MAG: signal peptide peptidase SppA [Psychromonas sp.]